MNSLPRDVLQLITAGLNDSDLQKVSQTRLWDLLHPTTRSSMYWILRIEHISGKRLDWSKYNASTGEWKRAASELQEKYLHEVSPLCLCIALDLGRLTSTASTLETAVEWYDQRALEMMLCNERIRSNALGISWAFGRAVRMNCHWAVDALLPYASLKDINWVFECPDSDPDVHITKRLRQIPCPSESHLDMDIASSPVVDLQDKLAGYKLGIEIADNSAVLEGDYETLLHILLIRDMSTEECLEYMHHNLDLAWVEVGFCLLLEPEMTIRKLYRRCVDDGMGSDMAGFVIILVCTHLGYRRAQELYE